MPKILVIAWREFVATVVTKGFIVGLLLPPVIMGAALTLLPILMNKKAPSVSGHIAIIDQSGLVAERLASAFDADKMRERRAEKRGEAIEAGTKALGVEGEAARQVTQAAEAQVAKSPSLPDLPTLEVRTLPAETRVEDAKQAILQATGREQSGQGTDARLALLVIPSGAVVKAERGQARGEYEQYELLVAPRLDPEVQGDIRQQANIAIVDARVAAAGLDVAQVRSLTQAPKAEQKAVTKEGTRKTSEAASILVPGAFMFLLWISVFTAGQYLLAGTIEEKGNRVMEVLLSAASPMELMLGKILGKGAVGSVVLLLYGGAGLAALMFFALTHLIAPMTMLWVLLYFIIAYATIACVMAAIGAAVTDVTEAQSLLGPVMMILVIPMILWMPIMRNPNSGFATVCSFLPLINPFVMVLRICGSEPIPAWQIPASLAVGALTVYVLAVMCAKIFRIGVLMYGKPPSFGTLLKWIRMA